MYTLYSYYRSSCSWRVRLALELKGLPYTLIQINLLQNDQISDDYLQINPAAVVPALKLEDGTILTQSVAILEYLEEVHGDFPLLPADPLAKSKVRQLVQLIAADCQPLQNLHVLRRFKALSNLETDEEARLIWGRHYIHRALLAYTKLLDSREGFSCGNSVTLADLCLIPQLYNAGRFGIEVETEFPQLAQIEKRFMETFPAAFSRAHPDNSQ